MIDRSFGRGLALIAIALAFGLEALRYPIDRLSQSRPGLFPLMVSGLLLLIGVSVVVRSRFVERVPIDFNAKNIGIVLVSLRAFALVSTLVNMTLGIAAPGPQHPRRTLTGLNFCGPHRCPAAGRRFCGAQPNATVEPQVGDKNGPRHRARSDRSMLGPESLTL
jgi:hypothetical protein